MNEQLLSSIPRGEEEDDHLLPFPEGTPFKGVVRSKDFINGLALAQQIGLTKGTPINHNSGWLHYTEPNGYNIFIAKKALRNNISWQEIAAAQEGKEITIGGKTFTVQFISGMRRPNGGVGVADGGGQWDRYLYNVYGGELMNALPATREVWGSYTETMLGLTPKGIATPVAGSYTYVKETVAQNATSHATRGHLQPTNANQPNIMGVWWGDVTHNSFHYGWRPMLVEKGTTPPEPITPFKGEIAQSDFITTQALRTLCGQVGGSVFSTEPWLKIVENGVTYYTPKKALVNGPVREELNRDGLVDGTKVVEIRGKLYKVRLMTGRTAAVSQTTGGEYLRWIRALTDGTWANYTGTELQLGGGEGMPASFIHVAEEDPRNRWALCGYPGLLGAWYQPPGQAQNALYGWRPVLEEVEGLID
uniref:Virion structural protein n=1 Tax=Pseudomonas phage RVTF4 TaxID=3236931 RepID=A0AB39CCT5_9VIRU